MILIGIHGAHNSGVSIYDINENKVIGNLEIERVTRIKNDSRMDEEIIEKILNKFQFSPEDVSAIAYGYSCNPFVESSDSYDFQIRESSVKLFGRNIRSFSIPHHLSHAYSNAVATKATRILIFTLDGWGDNMNTCLFFCDKRIGSEDSMFKVLFAGYTHRCPAHMWESICTYNYELKPLQGPGKIMALAAYGQKNSSIKEKILAYSSLPILKIGDLEAIDLGVNLSDTRSSVSQDFAFALQEYTNDYVAGITDFGMRLSSQQSLNYEEIGYAGGLALNIIATSKAIRAKRLNTVSIPPFPNDSGLAFGNCIAAACKYFGASLEKLSEKFTPYLGPEYPEEEINALLEAHKEECIYIKLDPNAYVNSLVKDLVEMKICFRYYGKSESGPRALGNRSILYNPSDIDGRAMLNRLKNREWYRPFAPIILDEYAAEVLEDPIQPSKYMTTSAKIKHNWRSRLSVATHTDYSCRPQIIDNSNKLLYSVIKEFYLATGIPAIINTSFNINGPIVESPHEAFDTFTHAISENKVLYINNYRIKLKTRQ